VQWQSEQLKQIREEISDSNRRTVAAVAGAGFLIGAVLVAAMPPAGLAAGVVQMTSGAAAVAGAFLLLKAWWR
jgi:hypothetical protein